MESEFLGDMHIYTLCPKYLQNFFSNSVQKFKRSCTQLYSYYKLFITTCVHVCSIQDQNSNFQKGKNSQKNSEIRIFWCQAHCHIVSLIPIKFLVILCSSLIKRSYAYKLFITMFNKGPKFEFKKWPKFPEKLRNWNFLVICTCIYIFVLNTYKVSYNYVQYLI